MNVMNVSDLLWARSVMYTRTTPAHAPTTNNNASRAKGEGPLHEEGQPRVAMGLVRAFMGLSRHNYFSQQRQGRPDHASLLPRAPSRLD